jgi:hypothetical protein
VAEPRSLVRPVLIVALALGAVVCPAQAAVEIVVSAEDGTVYVDARTTGLFGPELEEALLSGLPARVKVELVLWERRSGLWDREVVRDSWGVRILFDLLAKTYSVLDTGGTFLLETADLSEVEELAAGIDLWPLCSLEELEGGRRHYLGVKFGVEPLSVDEVHDLERWLSGNVREPGHRLRDVPGQLVGILRGRLGLGERSERGRSADFLPVDLPFPD